MSKLKWLTDKKDIKYPLYYNIDDTFVVLEDHDGTVLGFNQYHKPYPPIKAVLGGVLCTKEDYDRAVEATKTSSKK